MDLGHPLTFGLSISTESGQDLTALARRAEELGLDTVSFLRPADAQDVATETGLDPWTAAAWVAAGSQTLQIAAGITLASPVPATIAKAAASLDVLSNGRAALILDGADVKWTGTPRELDFMEETVEVLRAMWDISGPTSFTGDFHTLHGAQPGPAPAHNITLWLTNTSIEVVGALADAWIRDVVSGPDGGLDLEDLRREAYALDSAAIAAGRDPREIVRRARVSPTLLSHENPVELLADLVSLGFSSFEITDPSGLENFAGPFANRLRERVAADRLTAGLVEGTMRNAASRAKRHGSINYEAIPSDLRERAVEPGDANYGLVKSTYMRGGSPALVLRPTTNEQVSQALQYAQTQDVELGIRSGGHGMSGRSTNRGGLIIDVGAMNFIEIIDQDNRMVRVGPGARWAEVARVIAPYDWAISSGDFGGVGVGGLATAGGVGFFGRKFGLTIDHLVAAEIVLADGALVRASETENPELFFGIRGAGANFGIVTAFEFQAAQVGEIGHAQLAFQVDDLAEFLVRYGALVEAAPRDLTPFLTMGGPRRGQPMVAQVSAIIANDDPDQILEMLQPFATLGPLVGQQVILTTYENALFNPDTGPSGAMGEPVARSAAINHITPELARDLASFIERGQTYFFQIRAVGGAVSDVAKDATAYAHRDANFQISAMGANQGRINQEWDAMADHFNGLYLSFDTDRRPEQVLNAFGPQTLARLRALKAQVDPTNVFRDNFNVGLPTEAN